MKIEAIKYSDYMAGQRFGEKKKKNVGSTLKKAGTVAAGSIFLLKAPMALAAEVPQGMAVPVGAVSGTVKNQIIHAFDPLVDLLISLSLPVASVILTGAALMILIGQREKGYAMMMQASLGYILMQLTPLFIKLLAGVGSAL